VNNRRSGIKHNNHKQQPRCQQQQQLHITHYYNNNNKTHIHHHHLELKHPATSSLAGSSGVGGRLAQSGEL
jgi:hypothetical protein